MNLVEVSPEQKHQIVVNWFGLNDGDVTTPDRSRKALEEVVGKLDAATMMDADTNALNDAGKKALNEVAKNQLPQDKYRGMCIDVMKLSPASAAAADADSVISVSRKLYWAEYTHGDGGIFGEGGETGASSYRTYKSALDYYVSARTSIGEKVSGSKVDFFAGTFTKDGETYLGVVAIWELSW